MLCELSLHLEEQQPFVLILVLMEYALRGAFNNSNVSPKEVLILVLMEYALRV